MSRAGAAGGAAARQAVEPPSPGTATASGAAAFRKSAAARRIGTCRALEPGPMLICIGSLHGNEPAGTLALERVIASLQSPGASRRALFRGDVVALRGNIRALARDVRFMDEDMNRVWGRARVAKLLATIRETEKRRQAGSPPLPPDLGPTAEALEQLSLLTEVRAEVRRARGPVCVLDLHTTSSESVPFSTLTDTLQNRKLAVMLGLPAVLGIEEALRGLMPHYFDRLGWPSLGVEGGRHRAAGSVPALERVTWATMAALNMVPAGEVAKATAPFPEGCDRLPRFMEVRYRHSIKPSDEFKMEPGYDNFTPVKRGQPIAGDRNGVVRAPMSGRLLMPLYQRLGEDGFFVVRPVKPIWLTFSRILRNAGAHRLATWLPGVRRHPDRTDAALLAPVARTRPIMGALHLLGYHARLDGDQAIAIRREGLVPDPRLNPLN